MNPYLLDTNICIYYLKGMYNLEKKIREVGLANCYLSEITILELLYGIEKSSSLHQEKNLEKLEQLQNSMTILPLSGCIKLFAKEKVRLEKLGKILDEFDLLIGCTAVAHQMILVTRNIKHFERIQNIQIENWIDG